MKKLLQLALLTTLCTGSFAQKKPLDWQDIRQWNRITSQAITDDGEYVIAEITPWVGDGNVTIYSASGATLKTFDGGNRPQRVDNNIVVATIAPSKTLVDSLKLAKVKDLPGKQLGIYNIKADATTLIDSLNDLKVSKEQSKWLAYRTGKSNKLTITDFAGVSVEFDHVGEYQFSAKESYIIFNQSEKGEYSKITIFDLSKGAVASTIDLEKDAKSAKLSVSEQGAAAYIILGKDKSGSENEIYYWNGTSASQISIASVEEDWIVNENFTPRFAESTSRLFFGVSPAYPVADTTILESNKSKVDVWIWNEPKLKTQQVIDYDKDIKFAYTALYNTQSGEVTQLSTSKLPDCKLFGKDGDSDLALVSTTIPYQIESMWSGKSRADVYLKNIATGEQKELFKGESSSIKISPDQKYLYWYKDVDSTWNAYSIADDRFIKLVTPDVVAVYDPSRNVPELPTSFGSAGWAEDDALFYIYDKCDIWAIDPTGTKAPARITDGYKSNTTYRIIDFDAEVTPYGPRGGDKVIGSKETLLLSVFDNQTKESGFASMSVNKPNVVKTLTKGEYRYGTPTKAEDSNRLLFTRENFQEFPNLYVAALDFKGGESVVTDVNPQQAEFLWGSVEQISWVSLHGDTLKGNLYKPENFDPEKKYPMICNFYERDSDNLYSHRTPEVHRSSIDYHYYLSNGYVIFNPDILYVDGYPGESCYNSLMPGVSKILEMGFVDASKIAAQGHSWGGYQVAYLATRTNMFAAIESGAPVVNMVSAYGGIRWESGRNRAFQYEHGQSRIGATPWETPARYTENSPIYTMDKVNTPILIMHNDKDGHVPWWQGIEYFIALRRLEKPAWLLNYNDQPHWPITDPNKLDFQTKMSQFFHHYLKGEAMPDWMIAE